MASETRKSLIRMASNYGRLFFTVILGLWVVRILYSVLGQEGYALIALLGSAAGLAAMIQQIARYAMIRELGSAYHKADPDYIRYAFNAALAIASGTAVISATAFAVLWMVAPSLDIPPDLLGAARFFILAKALECFVYIVTTPSRNMFVVTERFMWSNIWRTGNRVSFFVSALVVAGMYTVQTQQDIAAAVITYAWTGSGLFILIMLAASVMMTIIEPRIVPNPRRMNKESFFEVLKVFGWQTLVIVSNNLHLRAGGIIVNLVFGLMFNAPWGVAVQLAGYVRMLTTGAYEGLDAVSARMDAKEEGKEGVKSLMHHSTRLNALVSIPAGIVIVILTEPILRGWLGPRLRDYPEMVPVAVLFTQLLAIGTTTRSIADGWMKVLYGAGFIRQYAPLMIIGGICNPVFAIFTLWLLPKNPDGTDSMVRLAIPALSYAIVLTVSQLFVLPAIAARCLEIRYRDLLGPVFRPAVVSAICSPILLIATWKIQNWHLVYVGLVVSVYSAAVLGLSWRFVLSADERQRFLRGGKRLLGKGGGKGGGRNGGGQGKRNARDAGERTAPDAQDFGGGD